jgi:hypothetical protein
VEGSVFHAYLHFETLKSYLQHHGKPVAFYSDKHSIFRVSREDAAGGDGITQFGTSRAKSLLRLFVFIGLFVTIAFASWFVGAAAAQDKPRRPLISRYLRKQTVPGRDQKKTMGDRCQPGSISSAEAQCGRPDFKSQGRAPLSGIADEFQGHGKAMRLNDGSSGG